MTILSFILLLYPLVANSYIPDYNLAINCGSSNDTTTLDSRTWVGDNSNLFTFTEPKITKPSLKLPPNSLSNAQTPYTTARISLSNFTYYFPIITNYTVFLRLHFYPTSYQNFDRSNSLFSVEVNNNLTLLKDFNPLLWLDHVDDVTPIIKEYCIQIKPNEKLNITFIPNNINQSHPSYAFINGIEVVSMPSFLYYTNLTDTNYHIKSVEFDSNQYQYQYQVLNDKALEMVYRVNVGDNQVPPSKDTGMFRNWDNDFPLYLEKQYPQSVSADYGGHLNYLHNSIPNYTAPEVVYLTARSYGMNVTEDYNVTWNFEVDSTFTYIVRLHFCEFDWHIKKENDRIFQIFIDNKLAEPVADVISWTGIRMVPVHKDYVVTMYSPDRNRSSQRVKLSIKLQRAAKTIPMKYHDVTLNGIEIFKIREEDMNLSLKWKKVHGRHRKKVRQVYHPICAAILQ
ncbi:feronia receptor-like kinase [Trifolium medium]|uniref:Feronia receptor-like kinase n=1 Tax=Trifolium medium TaxID=97028 RepID=A0A392M3V5_9FABA|nr:feronia receptor-like kinase [Trifolium medium]